MFNEYAFFSLMTVAKKRQSPNTQHTLCNTGQAKCHRLRFYAYLTAYYTFLALYLTLTKTWHTQTRKKKKNYSTERQNTCNRVCGRPPFITLSHLLGWRANFLLFFVAHSTILSFTLVRVHRIYSYITGLFLLYLYACFIIIITFFNTSEKTD